MYKLELSSGKILDGLTLSGNTFKSTSEVKLPDFAGGLSEVKAVGSEEGEGSFELHNAKVLFVRSVGSEWWFALGEYSAEELTALKLRADVEYVAMMAGVEL